MDSLLIVFSILLALAANAAWGARQDGIRVGQALSVIDAEVAMNRSRVAGMLPYHRQILDVFVEASELEGEDSRTFVSERGFEGFRPPALVGAAWEAAVAAGVPTLMDFETVSSLGQVYAFQGMTSDHALRGLQAMVGPGAFRLDNSQSLAIQATAYLSDLVIMEEQLLSLYDGWMTARGIEIPEVEPTR